MRSRHHNSWVNTTYLETIYKPTNYRATFSVTCEKVSEIVKKNPKVRAIAFRGSSGAALAFPIALHLDLGLIHVRKRDGNHSGRRVEGMELFSDDNYIIIDDFASSGATLTTIMKEVSRSKLTDVVLYRQRRPYGAKENYPVSYFNDEYAEDWDFKSLPKFHFLKDDINERVQEWDSASTNQKQSTTYCERYPAIPEFA